MVFEEWEFASFYRSEGESVEEHINVPLDDLGSDLERKERVEDLTTVMHDIKAGHWSTLIVP